MAKIAVIMPVYNAAKYLKASVESVLSQTFDDFVLYAVNDGSTDDSLKILEAFDDPRLKIINKPENSGIVETLNLGIESSEEQFIARMDADDICLPDRFEKQIQLLENNSYIGVVGGQIELFGDETGVWPVKTNSDEIKAKLLFRNALVHPTVMIRRSVLDDNELKYEKGFPHQEDFILWFRLLGLTEFANLDSVVLKYRREGQNLTEQNRSTEQKRVVDLFEYVLKDLGIKSTEQELILHYFGFSGWRVPLDKNSLMVFRNHLKKVLNQNQVLNKYPHKELKKVVRERWDDSFPAVLKAGKKLTLNYWLVGKRVSLNQIKAFLVYNIRKS